jgi:signal transduction histidine kinase
MFKQAITKSPLKILYVEDDKDIRDNIFTYLSRRIETVLVAEDGEIGLELFKIHRPDLVISDIRMPKLDGIEMSKRIKSIDPDVSIIIMSAFSDVNYLLDSINIGIDQYIIKPMDFTILQSAISRCEKIIRLRTENELQKFDLLRSKEKAEAANRIKERFVKVVAHDLKSPFVSILQLLELIKINPAIERDPNLSDLLDKIITKSKSQLQMIDDLLDQKRLESEEFMIRPELFAPLKVIKEASNDYEEIMENKRIQLSILIPEDFQIFADKNLFREVIKNLISNSIKFSHRGSKIHIYYVPDRPEHTICVEDFGIGLNPELLKKILTENSPPNSLGTEGEKGTGMGIDFVKSIVKAHQGQFQIDSIPNQGTKFYIYFPKFNC